MGGREERKEGKKEERKEGKTLHTEMRSHSVFQTFSSLQNLSMHKNNTETSQQKQTHTGK